MARTTQTRKRSRSRLGGRAFTKKRRVMRRSRRTTTSFTNQKSGGSTALSMFRRKPFSARKYRSVLWKDTQSMPHYRSLLANSAAYGTNGTGASNLLADIQCDFPLQYANVNSFWTTAGGLIQADVSITAPVFNQSSIVIRGGSLWYAFQNTEAETESTAFGDSMRLKFWFCYSNKSNPISVPAQFPTAQSTSWDPTCLPDFSQRYGKVYYATEVLLKPGDVFEFKRKLKTQKVDNEQFLDGGSQPFVLWQAISLKHAGGSAGYSMKNGVNLSLTGDATA